MLWDDFCMSHDLQSVRDLLSLEISNIFTGREIMKGEKGFVFMNWAQTYSCKPELFFKPETEEDVREILQLAHENKKTVKVVGEGHSPSDIVCTDDYMISMEKFNRLVDVNHEKNQVTVEAGMTMNDLNKLLKDNGMGFSVLGSISGISVAGMIATGTHGTGKNYGCSSTYIVDLDLMTANGDIIKCSRQEKPEIFLSACCSLGSLGVVLRVTLQCEPAFNLLAKVYPAELDDVLEHLDVHLSSSDHFKFLYFPHTGKVEVSHESRTDKPIEKKKTSWFWGILCGFHFFQLLYWISSFLPFLVKYVNRFIFWLLHSQPVVCVDWAPSVFNFDCLFQQFVNEWSIPRENTALVLKELQAWIINNDYPAHLPIEVRFVKADDVYLSPACGRDATYINIICYKPFGKFIPHDEYWQAYQKIVSENGGRPHWAKAHGLTGKELKSKYPMWDAFCQVRESLDPGGMFLNENLKRTLT